MLMTFISTASDDEIMLFYDYLTESISGNCDYSEIDYENMTEDEIDEELENMPVIEYDEEEVEEARDYLHVLISEDFYSDMKFLPEAMGWIFGLEYTGTSMKDGETIFTYEFDDGWEDGQMYDM